MCGYDFTPPPEKAPATQPAFSGGPPHSPPPPPKITTRDLLEPGDPEKTIFVGDYIEVKELAGMLGLKPYRVVAEWMRLKVLKHFDDFIDFSLAARIGNQHGCAVERL